MGSRYIAVSIVNITIRLGARIDDPAVSQLRGGVHHQQISLARTGSSK